MGVFRRLFVSALVVTLGGVIVDPAQGATQGVLIDCTMPVGLPIGNPGSYRLRRSVSNCPSDIAAIQISVSNVTLDLNGRLVDGDDQGPVGIEMIGALTGVVIRNGSVSDFDRGVRLSGGSAVVSALSVRSSDVIGIDADAAVAKITGNLVSTSGGDGILAGSGSKIVGNRSNRNASDGIDASNGNVIKRNTTVGNGLDGIAADDDNQILENVTESNLNDGLYLGDGNTVLENLARGNGNYGIESVNGNEIVENRVVGNGSGGIYGENTNKVKLNRSNGNGSAGIELGNSNSVKENVTHGNRGYGIAVGMTNSIVRNKASGNVATGIYVGTPDIGTVVKRNVANDNGDWGIQTQATEVGGAGTNRARDNEQPGQCDAPTMCV